MSSDETALKLSSCNASTRRPERKDGPTPSFHSAPASRGRVIKTLQHGDVFLPKPTDVQITVLSWLAFGCGLSLGSMVQTNVAEQI